MVLSEQYKGRKRISVPAPKKIKTADVLALRFEDMKLIANSGDVFYFNRVRYSGCPIIKTIEQKRDSLTLSGRDEIAKELYSITISSLENKNSLHKSLRGLLQYFKYLDSIGYQGEFFEMDIMSKCIKHYNKLAQKGETPSKPSEIRDALSWYLKQVNRYSDSKRLPNTSKKTRSTQNGALDIETELKPLGKSLIRGFKGFIKAINNNDFLEIHPMYDESIHKELVSQKKWRGSGGVEKLAFEKALKVNLGAGSSTLSYEKQRLRLLYVQASKNALFLFFMLTGMNRSVLAAIRLSDVTFKDIGNGRYVFDSSKFRANYKDLDNSLGFSKNTKLLIESWVGISNIMYEKMGVDVNDPYLIPYFDTEGNPFSFSHKKSDPYRLNNLISKLHGFTANSTRFRNTKSDILIRATDSVFITAQSLNNEITIVERKYSNGVESNHKDNLKATMAAQSAIAKGQAIAEAVREAKVFHSDILTDYDYKQRLMKDRNNPVKITPTGIRCSGPSPSKLEAVLRKAKRSGIPLSEDEGRCTDFLNCFWCEKHVLIASVNDIWLMLSFREQVEGLFDYVVKNSSPKDHLYSVKAILDRTLKRLSNKSPKNYKEAKCKISNGDFHPLYSNRYSLKYFFEE